MVEISMTTLVFIEIDKVDSAVLMGFVMPSMTSPCRGRLSEILPLVVARPARINDDENEGSVSVG
jgi:hypothetical protein